MHGSLRSLQACSRCLTAQHHNILTCSQSSIKPEAWSVFATKQHQHVRTQLGKNGHKTQKQSTHPPEEMRAGLHMQLANSAAALVAAMALLISPVGVSAAKRSAAVQPSAVELTASSSCSIQQQSRALATCAGSCSTAYTATLETAAAEHPTLMSPVGQVLIACRQLALLAEDVVYLTDHVVKRSRTNNKHLVVKCRWLQQLLGSRTHVKMLVLCAVGGLIGCMVMFFLGLLAPWANQHAAAASFLGLLMAQSMMARMPAMPDCKRGKALQS